MSNLVMGVQKVSKEYINQTAICKSYMLLQYIHMQHTDFMISNEHDNIVIKLISKALKYQEL